jgi:alkylhydroperoxidase/carboxymuconolactone decarboxylase family protein YurZ
LIGYSLRVGASGKGALRLGHEPDDIDELFIQLVLYVGVPRRVHAMRLAGEAIATRHS